MVGETEESALRLLMLVGLETEHLVTIEEVADRFGISKVSVRATHLAEAAFF
jgi:DNA-binding IscR family transcriptional regulator